MQVHLNSVFGGPTMDLLWNRVCTADPAAKDDTIKAVGLTIYQNVIGLMQERIPPA